MAFNKKRHLTDNIEALKIAFSGQPPTDEQREILSRYSGFGGLNCVLNPATYDSDIEN